MTCVSMWTVNPPLLLLYRVQGSNSGVAKLQQAHYPSGHLVILALFSATGSHRNAPVLG